MIVKESFFKKIAEAFRQFAAKPHQFDGGSDIVATGNGRAQVYVQTNIEDPDEHIRKLSASPKPYANVPLDD